MGVPSPRAISGAPLAAPVSTSQSASVPSSSPVARAAPSGLSAAVSTFERTAIGTARSVPVWTSTVHT
jgi:hypothetical protein